MSPAGQRALPQVQCHRCSRLLIYLFVDGLEPIAQVRDLFTLTLSDRLRVQFRIPQYEQAVVEIFAKRQPPRDGGDKRRVTLRRTGLLLRPQGLAVEWFGTHCSQMAMDTSQPVTDTGQGHHVSLLGWSRSWCSTAALLLLLIFLLIFGGLALLQFRNDIR
jgi:hypothetical protein